jgi:hypothetical protein
VTGSAAAAGTPAAGRAGTAVSRCSSEGGTRGAQQTDGAYPTDPKIVPARARGRRRRPRLLRLGTWPGSRAGPSLEPPPCMGRSSLARPRGGCWGYLAPLACTVERWRATCEMEEQRQPSAAVLLAPHRECRDSDRPRGPATSRSARRRDDDWSMSRGAAGRPTARCRAGSDVRLRPVAFAVLVARDCSGAPAKTGGCDAPTVWRGDQPRAVAAKARAATRVSQALHRAPWCCCDGTELSPSGIVFA